MVASELKTTKRQKLSGNYVRKWKLKGARETAKHPGLLSPKYITKKLSWVFRLIPRINPQKVRHGKISIRYELVLGCSQS